MLLIISAFLFGLSLGTLCIGFIFHEIMEKSSWPAMTWLVWAIGSLIVPMVLMTAHFHG